MQGRAKGHAAGQGMQKRAEGACNDVQRGRCKGAQREGGSVCDDDAREMGARGMRRVASQDDEKALSLA